MARLPERLGIGGSPLPGRDGPQRIIRPGGHQRGLVAGRKPPKDLLAEPATFDQISCSDQRLRSVQANQGRVKNLARREQAERLILYLQREAGGAQVGQGLAALNRSCGKLQPKMPTAGVSTRSNASSACRSASSAAGWMSKP